jgi:hypothetical protein
MATEKQYLFFKSVYDEETARQASLQDRPKYYLSIITFAESRLQEEAGRAA